MTLFEVLWKCDLVTLSKICLRLCPSAYLSINLRINRIISRIPRRISKIIFVQGSYESLAMLNGKTRQGLFSMVQCCKITVWFTCFSLLNGHTFSFSVFSLFSVVTFKNDPCTSNDKISSASTNYRNGTCTTASYVFTVCAPFPL